MCFRYLEVEPEAEPIISCIWPDKNKVVMLGLLYYNLTYVASLKGAGEQQITSFTAWDYARIQLTKPACP